MRKRTSLILFCMAFLSIVLLLGPTQANAVSNGDGSCDVGGTEETAGDCATIGGAVVEFMGVAPSAVGYQFNYLLTEEKSNVAIMDFLFYVRDFPIDINTGEPNGWFYEEGGGHTTGWGNIPGFKVAENNFNIDGDFHLVANTSGIAKTAIAFKIGNKILEGTINAPAPPAPPVVIDTEYIVVEGHEDYSMEVKKDAFGNLVEICLVTNPDHASLSTCTTGGEISYQGITINLGDLGDPLNSLVMCTSGNPAETSTLEGCDYITFSTQSEGKTGNSTCGYKFNGRKYAYTCW